MGGNIKSQHANECVETFKSTPPAAPVASAHTPASIACICSSMFQGLEYIRSSCTETGLGILEIDVQNAILPRS